MKKTVLGYSAKGVYVEVENSFASVTFDLNTTTKECIEVDLYGNDVFEAETEFIALWGSYKLSQSEIESLTEAFNFLVD